MNYNIKKHNDEVVLIEVNNGDKLSAVFSNFGAGIYALHFDDKPLLLEFKDFDEWMWDSSFYGKTLARVAGRIPCEGVLNGVSYQLNETTSGYCLHGGKLESLSFRPWKYEVKEYTNKLAIVFSYNSRNKDCGFPGRAKIKVIYEIYTKNNNLKVIYKASTPDGTLLNLSNHNYYNFLNSQDVNEYKLKVNAKQYGDIDKTSFIRETKDVPAYLDFRKLTKLKGRLDFLEKKTWVKTIDHTFLFDETNSKIPQVILKDNNIKLSLYTSYPCLNIFCDNFHKPVNLKQFKENNTGRRALALEPQLYDLDLKSLVLNKGEKYNHFFLIKIKDLRK